MLPDEKKTRVPRCRIKENLFIIDFTPTEDAGRQQVWLNSEKKTLRADNHSFFLTFDPEVILAPPGAKLQEIMQLFQRICLSTLSIPMATFPKATKLNMG